MSYTHILLLACLFVSLAGFGITLYLIIATSSIKPSSPAPQVITPSIVMAPPLVNTPPPVIAPQQISTPPPAEAPPQPFNSIKWQQLVEQQQQHLVQQHQHLENAVPISPEISTFTLPPRQAQSTTNSFSPQIQSDIPVNNNDDKLSGREQYLKNNPDVNQSLGYLNPDWVTKSTGIANIDSYAGQSLARQKGYLSPNEIQSIENRYNPHIDNRPVSGLNLSSTDKFSGGSISSGNAEAINRIEKSNIQLPDIPRDNLGRPFDRSINYQEYANRAYTNNPALAAYDQLEMQKVKLAQQQLAVYAQIEKAKIDLQKLNNSLQLQSRINRLNTYNIRR